MDPSAAAAVTVCGLCGVPASLKCSKCRCVYYCSVEHQKADWKSHKKVCAAGCTAKFDKSTGAPREKYLSPAIKESIKDKGITQMQQEIMQGRLDEFFAGLDGSFVVRLTETNEIVEGNSIPDSTKVNIEWTNSRNDVGTLNSVGFREVLFLSPASVAVECYAMNLGVDVHFKYLEGGILYVIGEPHIFWSMMIHRKSTRGQYCFPPPGPSASTWLEDDFWGMRELQRMIAPSQGGNMGQRAIKSSSRSLGAVAMSRDRSLMVKFMMSAASPAVPSWWTDCELLWGGSLSRVSGTKPLCMFFCTPVGCAAGSACVGCHDEVWRESIEKIKRLRA